jgi:hypothetical protein
MKKLILSVTAIAGFSLAGFAQGSINFDGSGNTSTSPTATSNGSVFIAGVLDTATDINSELLYSSTAGGTYSPVVTLLLSSSATSTSSAIGQTLAAAGDITSYGSGVLYDPNGISYSIPTFAAGSVVYFEVSGSVTVNGTVYSGQTGPFAETLVASTSPVPAVIDQMPALNLVSVVPEPSTLAMAGVGLASMLFFRRKVS